MRKRMIASFALKTRRLPLVCALGSAFAFGLQTACPQTPVTITAHPATPGHPIPETFIGLGYETSALVPSPGYRFDPNNPVTRKLHENLAPGLLRFGGNSSDGLAWVRGQRTSSSPTTNLYSSDVDAGMAFARAVGWGVLWSLNMGSGTPEQAADEASYVYSTAGDVLRGLAIGNEPNLYHNTCRPSSYTVNDYIAEWQTFANAVLSAVPGALLTGWDTTQGALGSGQGYFTQTCSSSAIGPVIHLLSNHYYTLQGSPTVDIPTLLSPATRAAENTFASTLQQMAQAHDIPWRMTEGSSVNGGSSQAAGVADVFAAALWGLDEMFTFAGYSNAAGVNFHCGAGGGYRPSPIQELGGVVYVKPLYYGLLMFRQAAKGRVVPLDVAANGLNLTAYGAVDGSGTLRVTVINEDPTNNALVSLAVGSGYATVSGMRLQAPSLSSTTDITLGGASVAADGSWSPTVLEQGSVTNGLYTTPVSTGSALLLSFSPPQINLTLSGNLIKITFTGTLLSSTNVAGPYSPVPDATSPCVITPDATRRFYRAASP